MYLPSEIQTHMFETQMENYILPSEIQIFMFETQMEKYAI